MSDYPAIRWDVADIVKTCATCHATFTEDTNIGRWACHVHPGGIVDGAFACCGQKTRAATFESFIEHTSQPQLLGCRLCDHRADLDRFYNDGEIQFSSRYINVLKPLKASIVKIITTSVSGLEKTVICSRIETDAHYHKRTQK